MSRRVLEAVIRLNDQITAPLKAIQNQVKTMNSDLDNVKKASEVVTKGFKNVAKAGVGMATAVTGFGTVALNEFKDFEASMSQVQAVSNGISTENLQALTDEAKRLGSVTSFSATEVADAMGYLGMAGWEAEQSLEGITHVLSLANAGGSDLAFTADLMTDSLDAFGASASDAERFADVWSATMTGSSTNLEQLSYVMKDSASVAKTLGVSLEDLSVVTGLMANTNTKGASAGVALRNGMLRLANPSNTAMATMEAYGIQTQITADGSLDLIGTIYNLRDALNGLSDVEQANVLKKIFEESGVAPWAGVLNSTDEQIQGLADSIYNSSGMAQEMADIKLDNLDGQIKLLQSSWSGLLIEVGERLAPLASKVLSSVTQAIDSIKPHILSLMDYITDNWDSICNTLQKIVPIVLGIASSFGAFKVISTVVTLVKGIGSAFTIVKTASALAGGGVMGLVKGIFALTNPVLLVSMAIGGLVYAMVRAYQNGGTFRESLDKLGQALKPLMEGFLSLMSVVGDVFSWLLDLLMGTVLPSIIDFVTIAVEWFVGLGDKIKANLEKIQTFFAPFIEFIKNAFNNVKDFISNFSFTGLGEMISGMFKNMDSFILSGIELLLNIFKNGFGLLPNIIATILSLVSPTFSNFFADMKEKFDVWIENVRSSLGGLHEVFNGFTDFLSTIIAPLLGDIWNNLILLFDAMKNRFIEILQLIQNSFTFLVDAFMNGCTFIVNAFNSIIEFLVSVFTPLFNGAFTLAQTILQTFLTIAQNILTNLLQHFSNVISMITSVINGDFKGAFDTAKSIVQNAVNVIKGIWQGLVNLVSTPIKIATNVVKTVTETFSSSGKRSAFGTNRVVGNDVPYRLHDGERVLTAREANLMDDGKLGNENLIVKERNANLPQQMVTNSSSNLSTNNNVTNTQNSTNNNNFTINISGVTVKEEGDITKMAEQLAKEISRQLNNVSGVMA